MNTIPPQTHLFGWFVFHLARVYLLDELRFPRRTYTFPFLMLWAFTASIVSLLFLGPVLSGVSGLPPDAADVILAGFWLLSSLLKYPPKINRGSFRGGLLYPTLLPLISKARTPDVLCGRVALFVVEKFSSSPIRETHTSGVLTTVGLEGIATSWVREENTPRMVSTVWHPDGCYQSAVLDPAANSAILGYVLTSNAEEAVECHVLMVKEVLTGDPTWENWSTPEAASLNVIKRAKQSPDMWNLSLLDNKLREFDLPPSIDRALDLINHAPIVNG